MFIDYKLAIGMLVVAGHQVRFENHGIIHIATGKVIANCFKDGTTFKVKEEKINDFISDNTALAS